MKLKYLAVISSGLFLLIFCLLLFVVILLTDDDPEGGGGAFPDGGIHVSEQVLEHKPMVETYAKQYGIEEHMNVLLAIIQVESGGTQEDDSHFSVVFTVNQSITENESTKVVRSAYEVSVHVDSSGNMVIVRNPTLASVPSKSGYTLKAAESDGTVDAATSKEISDFLITFFKLYPTATEKELAYYVNEGVLKPVGKDCVFSELVNPVYNHSENRVTVSVAVKYLDQQTKAIQISQFKLVLEKDENWRITGNTD